MFYFFANLITIVVLKTAQTWRTMCQCTFTTAVRLQQYLPFANSINALSNVHRPSVYIVWTVFHEKFNGICAEYRNSTLWKVKRVGYSVDRIKWVLFVYNEQVRRSVFTEWDRNIIRIFIQFVRKRFNSKANNNAYKYGKQ